MTNSTQDRMALPQAIKTALDMRGVELLEQPVQLRGVIADLCQNNAEQRLFIRNCDEAFLAPFVEVVFGNEAATEASLRLASARTRSILVAERNQPGDISESVANQVCEGVMGHLGLEAAAPVPPEPEAVPEMELEHDFVPGTEANDGPPIDFVPEPEPKPKPIGKRRSLKSLIPRPSPKAIRWLSIAVAVVLILVVTGLVSRRTIKFSGNGATSGSVESISSFAGATIELPQSSYTRSGYAFAGWAQKGSSHLLKPGETVEVTESCTYEALWYAEVRFVGGSDSSGDPLVVNASLDGNVTLPQNSFSRTDCRFGAWGDDYDDYVGDPGDTIKVTGPTTFYVLWEYRVSFSGNGADSGSVDDVYTDIEGKLTLPENGFERTDCHFGGWGESTSESNPAKAGETFTVNGPTTLRAQWKFRVRFKGNGSTGGTTKSVYTDTQGNFTFPKNGYSRTDFNFDGWASSASGSGSYDPGDTKTVSEPKVFYAAWKLDPSVKSKLAVETVEKDWESGGHTTFLYITNNASVPLRVWVDFFALDSSGNQIDASDNRGASAIACGETIFLVYTIDDSRYARTTYELSPEVLPSGHTPLYGNISRDEVSITSDAFVLRITNTSNKRAYINYAILYGWGYYGAEALRHGKGTDVYLDPGEHADITFEGNGFDLGQIDVRNYYIDGHLE